MSRQQQFLGISATLLIHGALIAVIIGGHHVGCLGSGTGEAEASGQFKDSRVISAGLARKKVEKKSRQPQKRKKKTFKPNQGQKVTRDENAPTAKKKKDNLRVKPDEIDFKSVFDKNRVQDDDLGTKGVDEVPVDGSATGSVWGTEKQAHGDPYVGELRGRIWSVWRVPSLETGSGKVEGCVRLAEDGKITARETRKKSKNSNLNRSVYLALKNAPDMDKPVPAHIKQLLVVEGICFEFNLEEEN